MSKPQAPTGLRAPGRRLWSSITSEWSLEEHELQLLVQIVRTIDQLDQLDALVRDEGPVVESPQGSKAHPALVEARQQRLVLARLIAALRLPVGEDGEQSGGTRRAPRVPGGYGLRGAV